MKARYSKFLNAKPKVYGIEILDIYLIFMVWILSSMLGTGDLVKIILPAFAGIGLIYYKKKFTPHYLYFLLKKKKYTKIHIRRIKGDISEA